MVLQFYYTSIIPIVLNNSNCVLIIIQYSFKLHCDVIILCFFTAFFRLCFFFNRKKINKNDFMHARVFVENFFLYIQFCLVWTWNCSWYSLHEQIGINSEYLKWNFNLFNSHERSFEVSKAMRLLKKLLCSFSNVCMSVNDGEWFSLNF